MEWDLPEDYGVTELYLCLRVCERFGMDPRSIDGWDSGLRTLLLDNERLRQQQECRREASLAGRTPAE